jgi:cellulose 1,4-beta-cellobiosidase
VQRSTTSGGPYSTVGSPATNSYSDTGLAAATTYYYVVEAVNGSGTSASSAQVSALTVPAAPSGVTATPVSASQVNVSWTATAGATSYTVQRSTTSGGPYTTVGSPTTNSFSNTGLTAGTTYYYVVEAVNASGTSAASTQVSALTMPAAPTGVTAAPVSGAIKINLSWTAVTGATSYNVQRSTTTGGPYTSIGTPTTASFSDTTGAGATTYYYVVSAVNGSGSSANSTQVSALTVPAAPTGLTNTHTGHSTLTPAWNAVTGATSYTVERSTTSGGPYTVIATGVTSTSYADSGLSQSTTYYYVVVAVNASGSSPLSAQLSATTL